MPESLSDGGTVVLVTGGAGYVGAHTCKALRRTGYTPVVFDIQISINRGQGFQQLGGITPVNPGDVVMASEGGRGWIIYPDCDVEVLPGKVYTVEDRPGVVEVKDAKEPRPICKRALPYWLLAAPVAVGVCAAADCFDDDNGRPASP